MCCQCSGPNWCALPVASSDGLHFSPLKLRPHIGAGARDGRGCLKRGIEPVKNAPGAMKRNISVLAFVLTLAGNVLSLCFGRCPGRSRFRLARLPVQPGCSAPDPPRLWAIPPARRLPAFESQGIAAFSRSTAAFVSNPPEKAHLSYHRSAPAFTPGTGSFY